MKRACRRLNPIKFMELWTTLARFVVVDARTFLLYICRRSNDEKGRMDVYVCVCICVLCAWREERTMSTADGSWGRNDVTARTGTEVRECTGKCACELPANLATISPHRCRHCAELQLSIVGHVSKDWK